MRLGADGVVLGVTAVDAAVAGPAPMALTARTRRVYEVPFVKPVNVYVRAVAATVVQLILSELTW